MISYRIYDINDSDISNWAAINQYIKENDLYQSELILHIGYGDPIVFDKVFIYTNTEGAIIDQQLNVYGNTLLIYGYTHIEEVPITHCEVEAKGVEE